MRKLSVDPIQPTDAAPPKGVEALVVRYLIVKYGVWTFFIFISFSIAVWQIYMLLADFFAAPHYISNSFFQHEPKPIFPNVTICNFNRANATKCGLNLNRVTLVLGNIPVLITMHKFHPGIIAQITTLCTPSLAKELGLTSSAIEHLFLALVTTYQMRSTEYPEAFNKSVQDWKAFKERKDINAALQKDPAKLLLYLGHSCQSTFVECVFGGEKFDCCENAKQILNAEYGACWVVNAPVIGIPGFQPKQPWRGISGGLKVVVNPSLRYYMENVTMNNFLEDGILLAPTFNPFEGYYPSFVAISPGTHARVSMSKRIRISDIPDFQIFGRNCRDNGKLIYVGGLYDQSSCEDDCQEDAVIKGCNCYQLQELKMDPGVPGCDGDDMANCIDELSDNAWVNFGNVSPLRACLDNCKPTCERIVDIATVTSLNAYPSQGTAVIELLKNVFDLDYSDDVSQVRSLILLDVFFPTIYYTMIAETEKVTMFELIGNIGGHLGLWLGVSLLSTAHMIGSFLQWLKAFRDARHDRLQRVRPEADESVGETAMNATVISVLAADRQPPAAPALPEKTDLYS